MSAVRRQYTDAELAGPRCMLCNAPVSPETEPAAAPRSLPAPSVREERYDWEWATTQARLITRGQCGHTDHVFRGLTPAETEALSDARLAVCQASKKLGAKW